MGCAPDQPLELDRPLSVEGGCASLVDVVTVYRADVDPEAAVEPGESIAALRWSLSHVVRTARLSARQVVAGRAGRI